MKKKVVSVMLTLAMMAAMLAGCGDKKTADSELEENYESSAAQESQEESSAAQEESSAAQEESSEEASADEGGGQRRSWTIPSMWIWCSTCWVTRPRACRRCRTPSMRFWRRR